MKFNYNNIDNNEYLEALEEEAVMAKKTKKTKKNKEEEPMTEKKTIKKATKTTKEEIDMINEETITTSNEEVTAMTNENKEEETMTEKTIKTTKTKKAETTNRIIRKVTLAKKSDGFYDWMYEKIEADGVSIASSKKDYNEYVENSLEWGKASNAEFPAYMILSEKDLKNDDFKNNAKSACFNNGKTMFEAIYGEDGKVKIGCFASQGGVKSGERYYCDRGFVEAHKDEGAMIDYSADPMMEKALELRREISLLCFEMAPMYLNKLKDKSLTRQITARKNQLINLERKLNNIRTAMNLSLLHEKFTVAASNQATAFFWTPDKKVGEPMNVRIVDEIKVKVACEGYVDTHNENSWDVEDTMNGEKPYMEISIDDGSAFVDRAYAKEHGFFGNGIKDMTQARSGIGYKNGRKTKIALDFKGTIQIMDMPEGMKDSIYISSSSAKGLKRFRKEEIESCSYQFYIMDKNIHEEGTIDVGPQVMGYGLQQASPAEIKRLVKRQVKELKDLGKKKNYIELVKKMACVEVPSGDEGSSKRITSIVEHKAFEKLATSRMFLFSVAKQATAMYNKVRAGIITVEGASAKAQGDVNAILAIYKAQLERKDWTIEKAATIPANTVVVPKEWRNKWGLKKGQKLFIYRNPYNTTIACIVTIHDFSDLRNTIQFSALDSNSHVLASDNDGDTIYASWNETIISIFEKANKFARKCGAKILAYRTGEEDVKDRGIPANEYLEFAPANGAVGIVCEPLFGLMAMIPHGCKNPEENIYCGQVEVTNADGTKSYVDVNTTPEEIYSLLGHGFVGTTYTIDSAKKHYVNLYSKTAQTKRINEIINSRMYYTKVFYHPNDVKHYDGKFKVNGREVERIGEDGGLATLSKIVVDELGTDLDIIDNYIDILDGYERYVNYQEMEPTHGFVYCPADDSFEGLNSDTFMIETGLKEADEDFRDGGLFLDVPQLTTNKYVKVDGKAITGKAVRSWLLNNMTERTSDMSDEERWSSVSLDHGYNQRMTIGLLRNRMLHAQSKKEDHSVYEKKGTTRNNIDKHILEVIKEWVRIYCEVKCSDEQAMDLLYNEVASYLFSGAAGEAYGSDVQAFLANPKFVNRLFRQEQKWLQKKVDAGVYKFDDLTVFEKDLYQNKVVLKSDEEIDAENKKNK